MSGRTAEGRSGFAYLLSQVALTNFDDQAIRLIFNSNVTSPRVVEAIKKSQELKLKVAETQRELALAQQQLTDIERDQQRLRANLKEMPQTAAAYKRYLKKFDDQETEIESLQKEIKKTIVFITHDLDEALWLGDRIAILRDGEVIQQGTSQEIVLKPADEYIARFVKEVNRGRVLRVGAVMDPVISTTSSPRNRISIRTTLEDTAQMLAQSGEDSLGVIDDDGRMAGVVDIRLIIKAIAPPEPTPVENLAIRKRHLIHNEDTLTPTVL